MRVSVEVCCTSLAEAIAADQAGADSVEMCSWLACGGITPSLGLVAEVRHRVRAGVRVLIRATPNGFVYEEGEKHAMLRDVDAFGRIPGVGLVVGALDEEGDVDRGFMDEVLLRASGRELTFHRAIDTVRDPLAVMASCKGLGLQRVLSSGARRTATEGIDVLRDMVKHAGELTIAAAGGVSPENAVGIVQRTGVREVHLSAQRNIANEAPALPLNHIHQEMSFAYGPDPQKIEGVLQALRSAGMR